LLFILIDEVADVGAVPPLAGLVAGVEEGGADDGAAISFAGSWALARTIFSAYSFMDGASRVPRPAWMTSRPR
jgi:hypothetical protein